MTLIVTLCMAIVCTIIWYKKLPNDDMNIHTLCSIYWGASLMWFVDAIFEYVELKSEYFYPAPLDILNDFFLGISAVILGLIIWLITLFIKDPKNLIKNILLKQK